MRKEKKFQDYLLELAAKPVWLSEGSGQVGVGGSSGRCTQDACLKKHEICNFVGEVKMLRIRVPSGPERLLLGSGIGSKSGSEPLVGSVSGYEQKPL